MLKNIFEKIFGVKINQQNMKMDILEFGILPEEVVYLLIILKNEVGLELGRFIGDFPITFEMLGECIDEKSSIN